MAASLKFFVWAISVWSLVATADAIELLSDPTRPANLQVTPSEGASSSVSVAQTLFKEELQSIIISPKHRAAVINGVTVELGDKIGDSTLVEVRESSVVLKNAQGRREVELFPGVRINKVVLTTAPLEKITEAVVPDKPKKKLKHKTKKIAKQDCLD